jgi:glutaredoxin
MACEKVKEFLSREGHSFVVKNVEEDDAAYDELIALGFRTIPVTVVNGESVKGFDEPRLRSVLESAGSQPPDR